MNDILIKRGSRNTIRLGVFGGQSFEKDMKMLESIRRSIGDTASVF